MYTKHNISGHVCTHCVHILRQRLSPGFVFQRVKATVSPRHAWPMTFFLGKLAPPCKHLTPLVPVKPSSICVFNAVVQVDRSFVCL